MNIDLTAATHVLTEQGAVILLESQSPGHPWSRRSYIAARPEAEIRAYGSRIVVSDSKGEQTFRMDPWQALRLFRERYGGWQFGYLGYDLKNHTEHLSSHNPDAIGAPDLYFMAPRLIIEHERHPSRINIIKGSFPTGNETGVMGNPDILPQFNVQNIHPRRSREDYLGCISAARRAIAAGDFYEINLSHQLQGEFLGSALSLYESMKRKGPVPFGAYMQTADCTVCCQSPERFLRREGRTVFTQPIKGTAQRGKSSREDQIFREKLANSAKERAENLMIVDLARNDLSRIAKSGSVKVTGLFDIETFGTVHQMVSTIEAETAEEDPVSILKSCFPMGSMTGTPKISVMKSIEQLENYRRGIYSGAIGYIKPNNDFDFNVVIRTAIIRDNALFYAVGGAITGDSEPVAEWEETLVKARALFEAVGGAPPSGR